MQPTSLRLGSFRYSLFPRLPQGLRQVESCLKLDCDSRKFPCVQKGGSRPSRLFAASFHRSSWVPERCSARISARPPSMQVQASLSAPERRRGCCNSRLSVHYPSSPEPPPLPN